MPGRRTQSADLPLTAADRRPCLLARISVLGLIALLSLCGGAAAHPSITTVNSSEYGISFSIPIGWSVQIDSAYQVVARGKEGGLETHAVVLATPEKAVHDYFLIPGEAGPVHKNGRWTCASSRSWSLNPRVGVVVCAKQLGNGNALMVSLIAEKSWLGKAGGERFLRSLVSKMRGFHADDD